mgnify:CR=1 FL=1
MSLRKSLNAKQQGRRDALAKFVSIGLLSASAGLGCWRYRDELIALIPAIGTTVDNSRPTIMFMVGDKMTKPQWPAASSMTVRKHADDNQIEYRRYTLDADLTNEEQYIRDLQVLAVKAGEPCMILVDAKGRCLVASIPKRLEDAVAALENHCGL